MPTIALSPPLVVEPVAAAVGAGVPVPLPGPGLPELVAVVDAVAETGVVEGVILGPGPLVIMSPFPPGYVAPAAAVKSCGT